MIFMHAFSVYIAALVSGDTTSKEEVIGSGTLVDLLLILLISMIISSFGVYVLLSKVCIMNYNASHGIVFCIS